MAVKHSECIFGPCNMGHPALLTIYTILNLSLLLSVIILLIKTIRKYLLEKKSEKKPKLILFIEGTLFNIVTISCLIWLLIMSILKFQSLITGSDLNPIYYWFHEVFVLFYGKQGCLLLLFLFTRLRLIFNESIHRLTTCTTIFFNLLFITAIIIFTYVPIFSSFHKDNPSFWVICSGTLCFFNLFVMSSMTYLFTYKLVKVYKIAAETGNAGSFLMKIITKMSLLGMVSITMTAINCILLILRYAYNIDNTFITMSSNLLIPIDIWCNWICVVLSYGAFDKYYYKFCGKCDSISQKIWYYLIVGGSDVAELEMHQKHQFKSKSDDVTPPTQSTPKGGSTTDTIITEGRSVTDTTIITECEISVKL